MPNKPKKKAKKSEPESSTESSTGSSTEISTSSPASPTPASSTPASSAAAAEPDPSPVKPKADPKPIINVGSDAMQKVSAVVAEYLEGMKLHEKITLKDLAELVSASTGIQPSVTTPVISLLTKSWPGITIEKGRFGGIYKGGREVEPKKPDERPRCSHCHQIIRAKSNGPRKPRKKKDAENNAAQINAADGADATSNESAPVPAS